MKTQRPTINMSFRPNIIKFNLQKIGQLDTIVNKEEPLTKQYNLFMQHKLMKQRSEKRTAGHQSVPPSQKPRINIEEIKANLHVESDMLDTAANFMSEGQSHPRASYLSNHVSANLYERIKKGLVISSGAGKVRKKKAIETAEASIFVGKNAEKERLPTISKKYSIKCEGRKDDFLTPNHFLNDLGVEKEASAQNNSRLLIYMRKHRNEGKLPGKLELISRTMKYSSRDRRSSPLVLEERCFVKKTERQKAVANGDEKKQDTSKGEREVKMPKRKAHTRKPSEQSEVKAEDMRHWMPPIINYGNKLSQCT